jgi:hypothetical protein
MSMPNPIMAAGLTFSLSSVRFWSAYAATSVIVYPDDVADAPTTVTRSPGLRTSPATGTLATTVPLAGAK